MAISSFQIGAGGLTAYVRWEGRKCTFEVVLCGENVCYTQIRPGKDRKDQFDREEREGMWLGHARSSNEVLVGMRGVSHQSCTATLSF